MAVEKARLSFTYRAGQFRASLDTVRSILILTTFVGGGIILLFSIYSLKRVTSLESDIKEKEKIITDWALDWQDTFDAVKDMIILLDKEGRPSRFNLSASEFFKDNLLREEFCQHLLNLKCPCSRTYRITISGRIFDTAVYKFDHDNLRCIIVMRDITEQEEMQERLKRAERLISLGIMAGGIAHEINNPLTAVVGFSELLFIQETDERKKGFLDEILKSAKRIQSIVNDLLVFGRKGELSLEKVMLEDFIDEVLMDFKDVTDIKITRDFSGIHYVMIDKRLFELVFHNLINNAIQAIRDSRKGDTVEIRTSGYDSLVKIEVTDNGPGMPEEIVSKVFEPFFTTKEVGKGTGLGLSIAHNIIVAHNGVISVRSKEGEGTVFTITLPTV